MLPERPDRPEKVEGRGRASLGTRRRLQDLVVPRSGYGLGSSTSGGISATATTGRDHAGLSQQYTKSIYNGLGYCYTHPFLNDKDTFTSSFETFLS